MSPHAPDRANWILSHSRKPKPDRTNAASRVHPMRGGEQLGGPNAVGKPGDWVLENDEVVFVIDGIGAVLSEISGGSSFQLRGTVNPIAVA